jgi:DNA repair protein RadC
MAVSIVEQDGRLAVSTPFHPDFPARARFLGGRWDRARQVWMFEAGERERVTSLCREIYCAGGPETAADGIDSFPAAAGHNSERSQLAEAAAARPHYFGHRERLRQRLIDAGSENLPDYEPLEMPLFAAIQRDDVKPVAKALLARLGGFGEVMSAGFDALFEAGLNLAGIAAIKSAREAALRLMRSELQKQPVVNSWDKLIDYCNAQVAHSKVEEFHILFLDRKNVLIRTSGSSAVPSITRRSIPARWSSALDLAASALILVHNHRSGDPTPSTADIAVTQDIKKAGAALGVVLHDHVIIGRTPR